MLRFAVFLLPAQEAAKALCLLFHGKADEKGGRLEGKRKKERKKERRKGRKKTGPRCLELLGKREGTVSVEAEKEKETTRESLSL